MKGLEEIKAINTFRLSKREEAVRAIAGYIYPRFLMGEKTATEHAEAILSIVERINARA